MREQAIMKLLTRHNSDHPQYAYWPKAVALIGTGNTVELAELISTVPELLWFATQDYEHLLLIHLAARAGDINALNLLVDEGVDVNIPSGRSVPVLDGPIYFDPGYSPIMVAALAGQTEAMKVLAGRGANLSACSIGHGSFAHVCVESRNPRVVEAMTALVAANPSRTYPSHYGVEMVATLKQIPNPINQSDLCKIEGKSGEAPLNLTPLQLAVMGNDLPCVAALIKGGVKLDVPNDKGHTALFFAVMLGCYSIAETLLRHGANPNLREALGTFVITSDRTPLHVAKQRGDEAMLELLIQYGADATLGMLEPGASKPFPRNPG